MAISANSGEYRSTVGLDSLYVAAVTVDSATGYTAGTPEYLAPAAMASQEPSVATETQYADDQPYYTVTTRGETKITLEVTGVPLEMLSLLTGQEFDAGSGRMFDYGGTPPYYALMFRSKKSNGSYRYYSFPKGTFEMPKEEQATQGETPEIKTTTLIYTALKTIYEWDLGDVTDGVIRVVGDTDTTSFSATGWFSQVQVPSVAAPSSLTLDSSVPVDDATGVARTADITLTFNNALVDASINYVTLLDGSLAPVTTVNSLDTTKKIMTVNPSATLGDTVAYTIVIGGVTDIYGDTLTSVVTFTTAS